MGDTKGVCDKCGQPVEEKVNAAFIQAEIAKLEKEHLVLLNSRDTLEDAKVLAFKELCRDETNYAEFVKSYKDKIKIRSDVKAENKLDYEVMRFWEKAFSQQGIIKFIIRNILDYLIV